VWRLYGFPEVPANGFEKSPGLCFDDCNVEIIMAVKIQLYGQLKQVTGLSQLTSDAADTDGLMKEILDRFPSLENLNYLIAVDRNIVQTNTTIKAGQELALLPPFSGG
jgi:molybdopterin converting factor small subunit